MSRRIATDQGGKRGPQSSRTGGPEPKNERFDDRRKDSNNRPGSSGNNQMMPGMPFPFPTMPNGMPMLPPGFTFPFPQHNKD
jgi:protein NRD1